MFPTVSKLARSGLVCDNMEVSFFPKEPNGNKETVLYAKIYYSGRILKYYLPDKIHPKNWSKQKQRPKALPEFSARLDIYATKIKEAIRKYSNANDNKVPEPPALKELLHPLIRPSDNKEFKHTLTTYLQQIIDKSKAGTRLNPKNGKPISDGTIKFYEQTLTRLEDFANARGKAIDLDEINMRFHKEYTEYLTTTKKLATNTIGKAIQTVKLIMNEAQSEGITTNIAHRSTRFLSYSEDTDTIYFDRQELQLLAGLDLTASPSLDRVRDLFLIGCYTGLRFSDYSILSPEQLRNGFFEVKAVKTGQRVTIPLHSIVKGIMQKYNGSLPKAITNQKMNDYIKDVCEMVDQLKAPFSVTRTKAGKSETKTFEKWKLAGTHTARRSFATNEYLAGTPTLTIMAITGHKTEKSFLRYIRVTQGQHAEILRDIWDERDNAASPIISDPQINTSHTA